MEKKKRKKNLNAKRPSLFTRLSDMTARNADFDEYPFFIKRRLQGYNTAIAVFIVFGLASWAFTKSPFSAGLGAMLAVATFILRYLQKREIDINGYENWKLEVLEHVMPQGLSVFSSRPTGIYAEALTGPYMGKVCHIALQSQGMIPPEGRIIELCVPGNLHANPVRDIYYIPQYFGIELVRD